MIQRKQSIYLFAASLISGIFAWIGDLWKISTEWIQAEDHILLLSLFLGSAIISLVTLFLYKNRKTQLLVGRLNILLNILLIGYLAYGLSQLPGGFSDSEKGIGLLAPFASIGLLFMANRYISKDEKLVKSVDRFR
ncbi:MAG TPA: DUF4293 domain-containing protein [Moheibacter sp.]|nr:DUF4293 domain-containing protein [Moheibacter sp.]